MVGTLPTFSGQSMRDTHHPAVDAALSAAESLLGMEVVFVSELTEDTFALRRVHGQRWPGFDEGTTMPRADSLCHRLLSGGPPATADAAAEPAYADAPARQRYGITSYVGVPIRTSGGAALGTLCGVDHGHVAVDPDDIGVLRELATVVAVHVSGDGPTVIRRTSGGWAVDGGDPAAGDGADDLLSAMVLADLLTEDLAPGGRPQRPSGELDEVQQLRTAVTQLEHALAARVIVEQAIGVLAERGHEAPRQSFERLRRAARSRGRRVHELAREVVASVTDRSVPLPPDLAGRR